MKPKYLFFTILIFFFIGCREDVKIGAFVDVLSETTSITGKPDYLASPFVTPGNRVYMVGHQDGSFPEIGWHIKGEMGGIWNHPIKLLDGFSAELIWPDNTISLDSADEFTNYSMANSHRYTLKEQNMTVVRTQFVPMNKQGIVVEYLLENMGQGQQEFQFSFTGHADLRPTWLGERTQMIDTTDVAEYLVDKDAWLVKDAKNDWFVLFGANLPSVNQKKITSKAYRGHGASGRLNYAISVPAQTTKTIRFTIAGSYASRTAVIDNYLDIRSNTMGYLKQKKEHYQTLAAQSKLTIPDKDIEEAFEWLKYNCDWLVQTVPEIGTGITAGIPDYPWWFGVDSEYALKGYMAIGQEETVYRTIQLLDSVSNAVNGNGKIIHEMSTNGAVFNLGNINETPQFASLIWEIYRWNGDEAFLENYFPTIQKGLNWLMDENDTNKNLFPDGFGMMEIHGLDSEMIDVAAYTQRAFSDASKIAQVLGKDDLSKEYKTTSEKLKNKINEEFWSEEFNSFADFIGTDEQALHLIEDAIIRADTLNKPWAVAELKETKNKILSNPSKKPRPFVLHHNWVVNTPMEMQIPDATKALKALETAEKFVNPFGVFVTGIDRDDSAGSDDGSFKGSKVFSYTGAVMTLPTGVQVVSENNYGRPDKALNYLKRMTRTFSYALPGSIYEVSPDYGMMTQAWNIYSYAVPIVHQFFGIQPDAAHKKVIIQPQMPTEWDVASLENVSIDGNSVAIHYDTSGGGLKLKVTQTQSDWTVEVRLPYKASESYNLSEGIEQSNEEGISIFTSKEKQIEIGVLPD